VPFADQDPARVRRALIEAGLALGSALSLEHVLQILVDVARELVDARYAALGVINTEGTGLSDFVTSGMSHDLRARIGDLPTGKGILGLLIRDARPLRLRDLTGHPASAGVPANHPRMRSFMGVPVIAQGRVFGNLYVTEKKGVDEFSEEDLALLEVLATQAAVAIERARLRASSERLTSAASHALGNSLAAVRLWAGTLLQTPPSSQAEWIEGVTHIASSGAQSSRLVDDLVTLTRIQDGTITLHAERVDLADLLRKSAVDLHTEAAARSISLDVQAEGPVMLELDGSRTRQLLLNLLAHAIAMSPAHSRVSAQLAHHPEGSAELRVRDAGPPVAASDIEALFDPPVEVGVHARGRGFGFELAVARQLARLMGGDLSVEGLNDKAGASFTLRLPGKTQR
jgi:K+-sensing histidine kinase KdpD